MTKYLLLMAGILFAGHAQAGPATYYCNIYTHLRGGPESSVFRFTVTGSDAVLSYTYRARPDQKPKRFEQRTGTCIIATGKNQAARDF